MDPSFWRQKWERNEIAFHANEANPLLLRHFGELHLAKDSRVFLPLCGKTLDIHWLLANGYRVAGAELSALAVDQLFAEAGVDPEISDLGALKRYSADGIDVFVGDIFELTRSILGPVDAIYDRAAFVALPEETRGRYAAQLMEITDRAPQLLISYEYDQALAEGPPFSVSSAEIDQRYGTRYRVTHVASEQVPGGLRGKCPATEHVWLLKK